MSRDPDEHGAVAVLVALLVTVLLGLLAIVVDLGLARDGHRQAQAAADSAALAAATTLSMEVFGNGTELTRAETAAVAAAKAYASSNARVASTDWNGCSDPLHLSDVPDTGNSCISFDTSQVRVVLPTRASPNVFSGAVGGGQAMVSASASAQWAQVQLDSCWLCLQSRSAAVGLDAGAGSVTLDTGNIRVGTTGPATLSVTTGSVRTSSTSQIGYTGQAPGAAPEQIFPYPQRIQTAQALAGWPLPTRGRPVVAPPGKCAPGAYSDITGCTGFGPGIYTITGPNVFTGSASLSTDPNVLFYFTCSHDGQVTPCERASDPVGGSITWSRTADLHVTGWSLFFWKVAVVVDPGNQAEQTLVSAPGPGPGRVYIDGMVFAPTSTVTIRSSDDHQDPGDESLLDVTGQVIVDRLTLFGAAAALRQHGSPPFTRSRPATPAPVHLIQ
jgi:hypothetical protein